MNMNQMRYKTGKQGLTPVSHTEANAAYPSYEKRYSGSSCLAQQPDDAFINAYIPRCQGDACEDPAIDGRQPAHTGHLSESGWGPDDRQGRKGR